MFSKSPGRRFTEFLCRREANDPLPSNSRRDREARQETDPMTSSAARMPIVNCYLSQAMLDRLAPLADKAGRELGRTVECAAVIRTAMTAWLHQTKAPKCPTAKPWFGRCGRVTTPLESASCGYCRFCSNRLSTIKWAIPLHR